MIPAARIQAAIELMGDILAVERPADSSTSAYFRERRFIGSKDRSAINNRIYRMMRTYHRLSWWIERAGCEVNPRTMVIADLMFEREHNPESIAQSFSGQQYTPDVLFNEEKKLIEMIYKQDLEHSEMPLRIRTECPEWAFDLLQATLGDRYEAEMHAMLTPAPLDIRVNIIKGTRQETFDDLKYAGMDIKMGELSPFALRLFNRPPLSQHPLFMEGYIEIQDEGSQLVAVVADPKPGEQVVDFCAGAGGKTLAMGAMMNNKGRIIAMDTLDRRLERARLRFRRAGLHNIETRALSSERDKWVKRHQSHFDLVLVDAPCTGTGTWRRDPDKRWRMLGPGITELIPLQRNILESAYRLVKPGGRLVYATCSILAEENENQIHDFIKDHPEFSIQPASDKVKIKGVEQFLKLSPAQHDTDGFFAAVLIRKQT